MKFIIPLIIFKYLAAGLIVFFISYESDNRTISVYELKFCDNRKSEQVYCASSFGTSPNIYTHKEAVPVFECRDLGDNYFRKLNVCDTVLVSQTVTGAVSSY